MRRLPKHPRRRQKRKKHGRRLDASQESPLPWIRRQQFVRGWAWVWAGRKSLRTWKLLDKVG